MVKLKIRRVPYGSKDTPYHRREYMLADRPSPVGFRREWEKYAKENGFDGVTIVKVK